MAFPAEESLTNKLKNRIDSDSFRVLSSKPGLIDFCSNDYLGFARSPELKNKLIEAIKEEQSYIGSTGSRLLSGNSFFAESLETQIAEFHKAEAALLFNSGYDANIGLFSSIAQRGDTVIYDEYSHASIIDGIRLSKSQSYMFRHNDLTHLEERLKIAKGVIYVAVESVYSMDGDSAPLKAIIELCDQYNANLIVDEAHATGLFGPKGEGRTVELGLESLIFARIHTFGKALGCHGAVVVGSKLLRNYLINFSRPFIYSTALPNHSLLAIKIVYDKLTIEINKSFKTSGLINSFKTLLNDYPALLFSRSESLIQTLIIPGNEEVKIVANELQKTGFDVRPVLSPTVPKNKERLRICLHTFNSEKEIADMLKCLDKIIERI